MSPQEPLVGDRAAARRVSADDTHPGRGDGQGELSQASSSKIPQAAVTFKFLTMNYSSFAGFPAPLTNGGLNEHHVAIRDVWSPSGRSCMR